MNDKKKCKKSFNLKRQLTAQENTNKYDINPLISFLYNFLNNFARYAYNEIKSGRQLDAATRIQYIKQTWIQSGGLNSGNKYYLPQNIGFNNLNVRFTNSNDGNITGKPEDADFSMSIGIGAISNAKTIEEVQSGLQTIEQTLYHEINHINQFGTEPADFSASETISYLGNSGEINSNASQYAIYYVRNFPGEPFDIQKLLSLGNIRNANNYFISFADPEKQKKYAQYADVGAIHNQIVNLTTQYVNQYNQQQLTTPYYNEQNEQEQPVDPELTENKKAFNSKRNLIAKDLVSKKNKKRENPIRGGKGDDLTEKDVSPQELEWGIEIEKEHSPKIDVRKDISFDHLEEDKKYYTHLREMEKKYKKKAFNLKKYLIEKM